MLFFFTKKQNISLNYYDFLKHFSSLCFFVKESGKVYVAKET